MRARLGGLDAVGGLLVLLTLVGCGPTFSSVHVMRRHVPLPVVEEAPAVGILQVHVEDTVLETAPEDFLHVSGLVVKAAKEHLAQTGIPVEDYVDLEDAPPVRWTRGPSRDSRTPLSLEALPPLPFGVRTPLVTLVEVWEWKVDEQQEKEEPGEPGSVHRDRASVTLLLSTWTREGEPVSTEVIRASAVAGDTLFLKATGGEQRVSAYLGLRGASRMPDDTKALFWTVLREAVGLHYASHLPYLVPEQWPLEKSHAKEWKYQAFLAERFDVLLAAWTRAYQADPLAHGALYNAALVHLIRGEDEQALPLLQRAFSVKGEAVYLQTLDSIRDRVATKARRRKQGLLPASERDARASALVPDALLPR
ncbi:hypothetical protein ACLESO_14095 [Pyxidicoccus sp. 3LG]